MNARKFMSKNLVVIVVLPALIGAHYGWYKLQQVDELVSPTDRERSPLAKDAKGFEGLKQPALHLMYFKWSGVTEK